MQRSTAARNWMLLALLVLVVSGSRILARQSRETAMDPYFRFVDSVKSVIPPGASYTALSQSPDAEMAIMMVGYGVLPDRVPIPSTYFGMPQQASKEAQYILAYLNATPTEGNARFVAKVPLGSVYVRKRQ